MPWFIPFPSYHGISVKLSLLIGVPLTLSFRVNCKKSKIWPQRARSTILSCGAQNISIYWTV